MARTLAIACLLSLGCVAAWAQQSQTLTWTFPTTNMVLRWNQPVPLEGNASSGLPVNFRVLSGPAHIAGGALIVTNAGSVTVMAEQLGDELHSPIGFTRTFNPLAVAMESLGRFNPGNGANGAEVVGSLAYVAAGYGGLQVLDVGNPAAIKRLGGFWNIDPNEFAWSVRMVGATAYVAAGYAGLLVLDVSDPAAIRQLGGFLTRGSVNDLEVTGANAYLVDLDAGLWVVDVGDPAAIGRLGYFMVGRAMSASAQVVGTRSYVAMTRRGLLVLDTSDPAAIKPLGEFATGDWALDVQVVGTVAYVAAGSSGLEVLDVSDPIAIKRLGRFQTSGPAWAVQVVGGLAYVAEMRSGLEVLDVSDPTSITSLNRIDTGGEARDVRVVGNMAYVSDAIAGLQILRTEFGIRQSVSLSLPESVSLADSPVALEANSSLDLPVACRVISGPATITGKHLILTGPGTVVVRAEQPGDEQVLPASTEKTLTVVSAPTPVFLGRIELVGADRIRIEVTGENGATVVVHFSETMQSWSPVSTNTLPATLELLRSPDAQAGYYRMLVTP